MNNNDKDFLGTAPIGKLLLSLALPTITAQLINMLYNIVDRIYIGHIPEAGALALTGVGVCMPLILIVSAFAALVGSGGAPRASILMGKQEHDQAEQILGNCFALLFLISIVLTVILLPSSPVRSVRYTSGSSARHDSPCTETVSGRLSTPRLPSLKSPRTSDSGNPVPVLRS